MMRNFIDCCMNFLWECIVVLSLTFLFGGMILSSIEAGQWKERQLLESVCKVNGIVVINDVQYQCGKVKEKEK